MQLADYFVSALWKHEDQITNLMLHLNKDNVLQNGKKVSVKYVIDLIKNGSVVFALQWNYQTGHWVYVAPLEVIRLAFEESLCCKSTETDIKLENLLRMNNISTENNYTVPLIRKRS